MLIATSGSNSVAAVNLTAFRLEKSIPLNGAPTDVVAGKTHSFVLTPTTSMVHVLDGSLNLQASKKLGSDLQTIRLAPDEKTLLLLSRQELVRVDTPALLSAYRFRLPWEAVAMDVCGTWVALSGGAQAAVELIDTAGQVRRSRHMPGDIGAVRFRKDGKVLLVANFHERCLSILDVPSLETIVDLPLAMRPENLCFSQDQGQLFVSGSDMDAIAILFPYQMEVEQTILAGHTPGVMACSGSPAFLFVASHGGSDVSILNLDDRRLMGIVEVGQMPGFITTTPDSQYALILNQGSGDLAVIHIPAIRFNRERSGVSLFTLIPVGDRPLAASIVSSR